MINKKQILEKLCIGFMGIGAIPDYCVAIMRDYGESTYVEIDKVNKKVLKIGKKLYQKFSNKSK